MDLQRLLRTETVRHVGCRAPVRVDPDVTVREAAAVMNREQVGSVLVCQGDELVGLLTERDVLKCAARGSAGLDEKVAACMASDPLCASMDESVASVICKMHLKGHRRLPVTDESGAPVGMTSMKRIVKYLAEQFPTAVLTLPPDPDSFTEQREGA